jgi:hypothetical protein
MNINVTGKSLKFVRFQVYENFSNKSKGLIYFASQVFENARN